MAVELIAARILNYLAVRFLTEKVVARLIVLGISELARRTDNAADNRLAAIVADALGYPDMAPPVEDHKPESATPPDAPESPKSSREATRHVGRRDP